MEQARSAALAWLEAQRGPEGAWAYTPGSAPRLEPTLWALGAGLRSDRSWLAATPWGWEALLVPALLSGVEEAEELRKRGLREILERQSETYPMDADKAPSSTNSELPGWSWYPGTFGWIEPTAMGLLSLRCLGMGDHPRAIEAMALLLDRQHVDGGWNYGNSAVLGTELESYVPTTAWAIMALPAGEPTRRALPVLQHSHSRPTSLSVALSILALGMHGTPPEELVGHLLMLQSPDGSYSGRCDLTALAATALHLANGGSHVFHLPA